MHGWLQRTFVSALAVGLAGVALGVPSSAETPPDAPSLKPRLSAIACTWLEQNPQLNHGLTCPKVEPQDQEREAVSGDVTAESADLSAAGKSKEPERSTKKVEFGANVDATNPDEDVASGQSETAIAVSGRYVVSVWNDATGFLIRDTSDRASLTGVGFSADGGKTFTDLGGLPNSNRCQKIFGDPAVVAHQGADGSTFFYVFSLYLPVFSPGCTNQGFKLSMNVGTVAPDGNTISFGQVIVVANGGFFGGPVARSRSSWTRTSPLSITPGARSPSPIPPSASTSGTPTSSGRSTLPSATSARPLAIQAVRRAIMGYAT